MSQIFCSSCGVKHQYTYSKPKFCSSCGQSFGAAFLPTKKQESVAQYDIDEENEDEDDGESTNIQHVPNIRNLQVDIEREDGVNQFTLGSLFGQGNAGVSRRSRRSKTVDDFISEKSTSGE
jgi:hypothetical protein